MPQISIDQTFLDKWPELAVASIIADVQVEHSCDDLKAELLDLSKQIEESMVIEEIAQSPVTGYIVVFGIEALMLLISLLLLRRIDVSKFRRQEGGPSLVERAAVASET